MIQPVSDALPLAAKPASHAPAGKSFDQILQEVGQVAEGAASGFLAGGPVGAAVGGTLSLLQSR
ncbi:MAG TPA: hypothetical protein VMA86_13565 [Acetobacteraceae bacterium]|nr:hypothetical protein [Acetobacteraceae bacterium]